MSIALADEVIAAADEIMQEIDNDEAYSFAESVKEKAQGIKTTMEQMEANGREPTSNQTSALQNMLDGAQKWLENQL